MLKVLAVCLRKDTVANYISLPPCHKQPFLGSREGQVLKALRTFKTVEGYCQKQELIPGFKMDSGHFLNY